MIPPELEAEIDQCCDRFERAWLDGSAPNMQEFLATASDEARPYLLWELVAVERNYRRNELGEQVSVARLGSIYPDLAEELANSTPPQADADTAVPHAHDGEPMSDVRLASDSGHDGANPSRGLHVRCPHCSNPMEIVADSPFEDVTCRTCGSTFNLVNRDGPTDTATTLRNLGRFELISRLGMGGFGTVWKARDSELDRLVAIKIPRKGQLTSADIEQFFREARAAAQLYHPNIVSVYEVGRAEDTVFIVSDLVRGVPLSDYLTGQKLTHRDTAEMGVAIADALQHAHDQGVIHRDLKPSNIMIDQRGTPLIMDFGLAKRDVGEITMTIDGQILGTPGYMSPEQARGQSHWTDRRSDVYSLGTVLFRMLTGELPFRGNARMQLHQKLIGDPPDPRRLDSTIPRDLSTICLKCIQRDPNLRYNHARDVSAELQRFINGEPIRARPLSRTARVWRWAKRNPWIATAAVLTGLLAIAGPLVAWQQRQLVRKERSLTQQRETRLAERAGLIARQKIELNEQSAKIAAINDELNALRGGDSGIATTLPSWRLGLITNLVAEREDEMAAALANETSGDESIQAGLGLGILLAQLGRDEQALDALQTTEKHIVELAKIQPDNHRLLDAHADCLQRIAKLQHKLGASFDAQTTLERAVALRRKISGDGMPKVDRKIRLLESATQTIELAEPKSKESKAAILDAGRVTDRLNQQWPTSAAEFYRLACQLTKSDVLLDTAN